MEEKNQVQVGCEAKFLDKLLYLVKQNESQKWKVNTFKNVEFLISFRDLVGSQCDEW